MGYLGATCVVLSCGNGISERQGRSGPKRIGSSTAPAGLATQMLTVDSDQNATWENEWLIEIGIQCEFVFIVQEYIFLILCVYSLLWNTFFLLSVCILVRQIHFS